MKNKTFAALALAALIAGVISVPRAFAREGEDNADISVTAQSSTTLNVGGDASERDINSREDVKTGVRAENEDNASSSEVEKSDSNKRDNIEKDNENATSTDNEDGNERGDEHRSRVASFVQTLLQAADRSGGIGAQVRVIAREEASSTDKVSEAIDRVNSRNQVVVFLLGSDFNSLDTIKAEIASTTERIAKLKETLPNLSVSDQATINAEIKVVEAEQARLESFVTANDSKFSLFGWLMKLTDR